MAFDESSVRPAVPGDARAIAEVHVGAWRTTYQSIFPQSVLDALSVETRGAFWKETLLKPVPESVILVGCDEAGRVVGFASGGAERTGQLGCDGELYAIYLDETVRGRGLGTLLVRQVARELKGLGFSSMAVWVLALNPYRRFYESLGGLSISEQELERGGQQFVEVAYGWRDLSVLIPGLNRTR
ncbi:MAG TPA: GNAT family N-acetyltransferase [Bryobacteraceae bacterium]|nr:GNAT family N-acetyltransferase [Bryobacteraceae bacterium]